MKGIVRVASIIMLCFIAAGTVQGAAIHPPFAKVWEYHAQAQFNNYVKSADTIYFGTFESYGAVDLKTGRRLWETKLPENTSGAHVAFDGKTLYAAVGQWKLLACEPKTGKVIWSLPLKGYSGPILVAGGVLYTELKDGILTALNTRTRKPLWSLNLEQPPLPKESMRDLGLSTDPLLFGGRLFIGTNAGEVICLNPQTGKIRWRRTVESAADDTTITGLAADTDRVYFTTDNGDLRALKIGSGVPVWRFKSGGSTYSDNLVLANGLVIFKTNEGMLYGINTSSGAKRWEAVLSREREPEVSAPVINSGQVMVIVASKLTAYNTSGKQLWNWYTEENLFYNPLIPLSDGVIVSGASTFYRFVMGQPASLPTQPTERKALAEKLVSRLDKLTKDEKRTLVKLGDDAFEPLLQEVQERMNAYDKLAEIKSKQGEDDSYKAYERYQDAFGLLAQAARENRTPEMLALMRSARTSGMRSDVLQWLAAKGDQEQTIPIFLNILKNANVNESDEEDNSWGIALSVVAGSSDPRAVSFLIEQLRNPAAPPAIRRAAFNNIARTGGKAGVEAVLAARDNNRTIPSFRTFMHLDSLGTSVKPKSEEYEWPWASYATLVDTRKDSSGALWGLISSRAVGSFDDLWIARYDGKSWGDPLFTGVMQKQLGKADWYEIFVEKPDIAKDTDGDRWTDMVEKRLGTDPKTSDTDKDGLKDSEDKNPLAAPRDLSEGEQVLKAAFQARFQFEGDRPAVCLVELPKGIKPFELYGLDWITVALESGRKSPLQSFIGKGVGVVSFRMPEYDFEGNAVRGEDSSSVILWNADRTEAKLQIATHFGGLDGTGFDIRLKKFGDEWVIVDSQMAWIS